MTSREALVLIKSQLIGDIENLDTDNYCWNEAHKQADINWWKEKFQTIEKDLKKFEVQSLCLELLQGFIEKELNRIDKELKMSQEKLDILYFKSQETILNCVNVYLETLKYESTDDILVDLLKQKQEKNNDK